MGRDKPKKNMSPLEKERYYSEYAKKNGIQGTEYRDYRGNTQTRTNMKAVKSSMKNDFDYRTSAQHMDGVKGNGKLKDFVAYQRGAQKLHRQAGNGGEFSSINDVTGVTNRLVDEYRDGLQDQISDMSASGQKKDAEEVVLSDRLQEDRDYVEKIDNKDYDIFNRNINKGDNQSQRETAADAFLNKFKAGVKSDFNLKPVLPI